ncbi:MAG: hypothetical protein AAF555_05075 [Verrucomicrobiota bacterium]
MSFAVTKGRLPGVVEFKYSGALTKEVRQEAVEKGWELIGDQAMLAAIVDFREADTRMSLLEIVEFQEQEGNKGEQNATVIIYIAGRDFERAEYEAIVGLDNGRAIEVVHSIDEAYELIDDLEPAEE